jgi:hypothetical protein
LILTVSVAVAGFADRFGGSAASEEPPTANTNISAASRADAFRLEARSYRWVTYPTP